MTNIRIDSKEFVERIAELAESRCNSNWVMLAAISSLLLCFVWALPNPTGIYVLRRLMEKSK